MSRRKKPDDETPEQAQDRYILESISNYATRGEKTSWNRLMDNMVSLLAKLKPIENKILELQAKKMPIIDDVQDLRQRMIRECIHPYTNLILKGDKIVHCKFCDKHFKSLEYNNGGT